MMFFRIPFLSNYISENIKHNLEQETLSLPNKSRLEMLIKFSDYFQHEMRYGQRISHYPYLQFSIRYSDIQKDIVFILIIFINAFFIIDMRQDEQGQHSLSPFFYDIYEVFAIIHICLSCTTVVIEMIERFPLLAYFKGMVLEKRQPQGIIQISIMFLRDGETMYYVIYLILTSAALITPLFYSLLLVDWIKRSQDVIEILKALTHKYQKILKTLFLQLIYIYCYALLGFIYLAEDYEKNQLGITLFDGHLYYLFSSTLLYGLIESQGINGILKIRDIKDSLYWTRFVLDLTFWIVINFYLTNLLLGVIIDTFAELRAIKKSQDKNLQGKCFICGLSQEDFEARTLDWSTHNSTEHNLYNYLNYIIYIKNKDVKDCDGLEKYVKECILNGKTDFFPKRDTLSFHRNTQNDEI